MLSNAPKLVTVPERLNLEELEIPPEPTVRDTASMLVPYLPAQLALSFDQCSIFAYLTPDPYPENVKLVSLQVPSAG